MPGDPMVVVTALTVGVDMDHHATQMRKTVEQPVANLRRDRMSLGDRQAAGHGHVHIDVKPMPDPARSHARHLLHARHA